MQVLLIVGLILLVLGAVLVFGLYPYLDSQASQQILEGLNSNMTSRTLTPNQSISLPYNANGRAIYIFFYNSTPSPLEVKGVPENDSSVTSSGIYYVIPNGSGNIILVNNWSQNASLKFSSTYYLVKGGALLGILILSGIPMLIIGAFVTIFALVRRKR
ncbi:MULTISPECIES: hypothetical protein [Metallosphaera]|uniref:hypothetical protein n=1 Tax=Metallosphaera TaxID=41980 RepID=UPI001F054DD2|nr:hypothetical protein [Metallosphaera sedula]MCH1771181.1 hypothetical protein [Metallosphaera sedula]MCP6729553.1 hypothetical protein [Metallosphaera sedula]